MEDITPIQPDQSSFRHIKEDTLLPASIILAAALIAGAWVYTSSLEYREIPARPEESALSRALEETVLPSEGAVLPVAWRDLGIQMVRSGAIDKEKFEKLYENRGGLSKDEKKLLGAEDNGNIKITKENSGFILNLFWALGLANKNAILEQGPMIDARYGGVGGFASTAGWTLAAGSAMDPVRSQTPEASADALAQRTSNGMDHYNKHSFLALTRDEEVLVERVSRNIYRPCCDNSTYFPDCNHGMAMLGLLELMASQGISEEEMYRVALQMNAYWFPDTYRTIATYMKNKGIEWKNVNPQEILGINYSSASGYAKIQAQVTEPEEERGGSGCGVDTGETATPQRQQSGCGI